MSHRRIRSLAGCRAAVLVGVALGGWATAGGCDGFTVKDDGGGGTSDTRGGGDGAAGADLAESDAAGVASDGAAGVGPGPYGALPSGYCCSDDGDCRYRNCKDVGGQRMCVDRCFSASACEGGLPGLTCVGKTSSTPGTCQLPAKTKCVPASKFRRGAREIGRCCVATRDNKAGYECRGNLCLSFGSASNPYICSRACDRTADCPGGYMCLNDDGFRFCAKLATTYSCQ